jgi:hypothetical protein
MGRRPPNYRQQRGDRDRVKEQKKQERLQRREDDAQKRREERDALLGPDSPAEPDPTPESDTLSSDTLSETD